MNRFSIDFFKILGACLYKKVTGGDSWKTIGGAGAAEQAVEKRLLDLFYPFQATLDDGSQKGQSPPCHTGLMARGSKYRARGLTETTSVTV